MLTHAQRDLLCAHAGTGIYRGSLVLADAIHAALATIDEQAEQIAVCRKLLNFLGTKLTWSNHNGRMAYVLRDVPFSGMGAIAAATFEMQRKDGAE